MQTYFISDGTLVKIGRSRDPPRRLNDFQTAHGSPLIILLTLPGDREREFHQLFARHKTQGEWFVLSYEILKFIAEHTHQPLRMSFFIWLLGQQHRLDDIGRFAIVVNSDPNYPRHHNQLRELRSYYGHNQQLCLIAEQAHTEWRIECTANDGRHLRGTKLRKIEHDSKCKALHRLPVGQFFIWLTQQRNREDIVGQYARDAVSNVQYPASSRLQVLLKYEPDETRDALKKAHREWRREHERRRQANRPATDTEARDASQQMLVKHRLALERLAK